LPAVERPIVLQGRLEELPRLLARQDPTGRLSFDAVVGRNALLHCTDKIAGLQLLYARLSAGGTLALAEKVPRHTQRLYRLIDWRDRGDALLERVQAVEEALYANPEDPLVNWDEEMLAQALRDEAAGLAGVEIVDLAVVEEALDVQVTESLLDRWFADQGQERPAYGHHLRGKLDGDEVAQVRELFRAQLLNRTIRWHSRLLILALKRRA
jgi:putative ATPase